MRLPKRIDELLKRKEQFLLSSEASLNKTLRRMQSALVSKVTAEIIPQLDMAGGDIRSTLKNYRLLTSLDKIYTDFQKGQRIPFIEEMGGTTSKIVARNAQYFNVMMGLELPEVFEAASASAAKRIAIRIGLEGSKMVAGGFLKTLTDNASLLLDLKTFVAQSVTGQVSMKTFVEGLNVLIAGEGDEVGGIEKQFDRYAHDIYMQYDSAYSTALADELKLNFFIYQGGLVVDSRDFCVANNNKVFHRDEAEKWRTWTPAKAVFPVGYKVRQKDHNAVPSYLNYAGYEPLTDRGGPRCRHHISWITDSLAERLKKKEE